MYKLGITGGIASGKSTAALYVENKNNHTYIFNADRETKKHLKSSHGIQNKIINVFGTKVVKDNKLNLKLLANVAFENKTNHKILNGIIWPEIPTLISKKFNEIEGTNIKLFIVDAALIFEANFTHFFDSTLLIIAPEKTRIERAINRKNIPLENVLNRILLQMSDKEKKGIADSIINNNGRLENFHKKLDNFYNNLTLT